MIYEKKKNNFFNLYPNPATGIVTISGNFNWTKIIVTDITGRVIEELNPYEQNLDVSAYNNGIYLVTCSGNQGCITQRITVQH
ncbi:MAG TPA: T9SS type A sorting domain-containing protein [Bacteroidia bacterium]|nr:T9SS type A sorting domain-containing protein [Bacteroidia bacterium]